MKDDTSWTSFLSIIGMSINGILGNLFSPCFVIMLSGSIIAVFGFISFFLIRFASFKKVQPEASSSM